jgi:hypothetical protein
MQQRKIARQLLMKKDKAWASMLTMQAHPATGLNRWLQQP